MLANIWGSCSEKYDKGSSSLNTDLWFMKTHTWNGTAPFLLTHTHAHTHRVVNVDVSSVYPVLPPAVPGCSALSEVLSGYLTCFLLFWLVGGGGNLLPHKTAAHHEKKRIPTFICLPQTLYGCNLFHDMQISHLSHLFLRTAKLAVHQNVRKSQTWSQN